MPDEKEQLRPRDAYKAGELQVYHDRVPFRKKSVQFHLPAEDQLSDKLQEFISSITALPVVRDPELREIRDQFEGGRKAKSETYFPKPEPMDDKLWEEYKKLLSHINLVQPAVRAWVNSVYSEEPYRNLKKSPFLDVMANWVGSESFAQDMYSWAVNKTAFGTSVAVPRWDADRQEMYTWLPDPVHTYILVDAWNRRKIIGVVEMGRKRIDFISLWGEGVITDEDFQIIHHEVPLDHLPATIGYGWNKTNAIYGIPMVRDAVEASKAAMMVWFNIRVLQKQQVKSILKIISDFETTRAASDGSKRPRLRAGADSSTIELPVGGDAAFISPSPKIEESIKVLRQQIGLMATASGIPADVLDPTLTESSASAEGSRIRAIPLIQNSKPLMRQWRHDESRFVMDSHYAYALAIGKRKTYADITASIHCDIALFASVIPQSANEETQDIIARVAFGLMTPEDAIRKVNYTKSRDEIVEMADELRQRMEHQGARSLEQMANGGGRPQSQNGSGGSDNAAS